MQPERDPLLRDQVTRLVSVLRQLATSRHAPVRHTARYDEVLWLDDVRQHLQVGEGAALLRVPRVAAHGEPPVPRSIRRWLLRGPDGDDVPAPVLRDRGPLHGRQVHLVDAPSVRESYDRWMATTWLPWASAERRRRPLLRIRDAVAAVARAAADRPESVELVLAAGLLHVPGPDVGDGLRVHLISRPVRIDTDPATGDLVCTVTGEIRLEDDELLAGLPVYAGAGGMGERLRELAASPVAPGIGAFLQEWAPRALTTACTVDAGWAQPAGAGVRLAAAPALVARRRGATAAREHHDALLRALRDDGQPVPLGLAQLVRAVEPAERSTWLERSGAAPWAGGDAALFPLPVTPEQARVLERIRTDAGVVVEGAAGTGRTHTAAAVLGALLARGQRVLVTGERAQPLRVLADMLPPGIRELCVEGPGLEDPGVEGPDTAGLDRTLAVLAAQRAEFDAEAADRRVAELTERHADAERRHAQLLARVRARRGFESLAHPEIAPGYAGTPAQIARAVSGTDERDAWVPGPACGRMPVTGAELGELLTLLQTATPLRRSRRDLALPDAPLPPERFAVIVAAIGRGRQATADAELVEVLGRLPVNPAAVGAEVAGAVAALRTLPGGLAPWAEHVADGLLGGARRPEWELATAELAAVGDAQEHAHRAGAARVEVAPGVDPAAAATVLERLAAHLSDGSALRRVFKSAEQRDAERLGRGVLVDGAAPVTSAAAAAGAHHLRVLDIARTLDAAFAPLGTGLPTTDDRTRLVESMVALRTACATVSRVRAAAARLAHTSAALPADVRPAPVRVAALERIAAAVLAVGPARDASAALRELDREIEAATPSSPEGAALGDALRALDVDAYSAAVAALRPVRRDQHDQRRCEELLERVRAAAPALAAALESDPAGWEEQLPRWPQAWARACAATWLAERCAPDPVDDDLAAAGAELRAVTTDLAVEQAWRACLGRMDAAQVQALAAYREAAARLGNGDGPQPHAECLRAAVRGWIMPIRQVLATVAPRPDAFDVVIVDDATQADLTSAFLLRLAPRVVVLGDSEQHAPAATPGAAAVLDRVDVELPDVPAHLRAAFLPGASLHALLRCRFGPAVVLRRDHRARAGLSAGVPVRPPGPVVLRASSVPGGGVDVGVDRVEARAVADAVAARAASADATFGVISLGGRAQADAISDELRARHGADALHRVRVGTPADLQGDERDIVWLSLGSAHPTIGEDARRACAVAASRARDELHVLHGVPLDGFDPADPRRALLRRAHAGVVAVPSTAPAAPFARRVHDELVAAGHPVHAQVELDGRCVDLVVTGPAGAVAISCDDQRAAPRPADIESEQLLRASGWEVVHVGESAHLVDPEAALAPVHAALDRIGAGQAAVTAAYPVVAVPDTVPVTAAVPVTVPVPVTAAVPVAAADTDALPLPAGPAAARPVIPTTVWAEPPTAAVVRVGAPAGAGARRNGHTHWFPPVDPPDMDAATPPSGTVRVPPPRVALDVEPVSTGRHALAESHDPEPLPHGPGLGEDDTVTDTGPDGTGLDDSGFDGTGFDGTGPAEPPRADVEPVGAPSPVRDRAFAAPDTPSIFDAPLAMRWAPTAPPPHVRDEDRRTLLHAATGQPLTVGSVTWALAVDAAEAEALLHAMAADGLLRRVVASTGPCYVLPPDTTDGDDEVGDDGMGGDRVAADAPTGEPDAPEDEQPPSAPVERAGRAGEEVGPEPADVDPEERQPADSAPDVEPRDAVPVAEPEEAEPEEAEPEEAEPAASAPAAPADEPRADAPVAAEPAAEPDAALGERALRAARDRPLTVAAVRNLLDIAPDPARRLLADLAAQGRLERRGHGRVVHYVLATAERPGDAGVAGAGHADPPA